MWDRVTADKIEREFVGCLMVVGGLFLIIVSVLVGLLIWRW